MKNQNILPISILVAGIIIAGAIVVSRGGDNSTPTTHDGGAMQDTLVAEFDIRPLDETDHIVGNPEAPVVIVEYSDTECPVCKGFHQTMNSIIQDLGKDGDVAWVYRHFPLDALHSKARREAEATECAAQQDKFWEYTNELFDVTPANNGLEESELFTIAETVGLDVDAFTSCFESGETADDVKADSDDAVAAGGSGTPFNVFLLKEPMSEVAQQTLLSLMQQAINPSSIGRMFRIHPDGSRFFIAAGVPQQMVEEVIRIVQL
jgi:protein-disulfide isomerase